MVIITTNVSQKKQKTTDLVIFIKRPQKKFILSIINRKLK